MTKIATIISAALAVLVLIVVSASGADVAASATTADRCLVCHPRAHVDDWRDSHANALALDPQQGTACVRCHTTSFCDDCHQKSAAGASAPTSTTPASGQELVASLCTACHSLSTVQGAQKDKAGWASAIERMTQHGLSADASQKQAILDYLSAQ